MINRLNYEEFFLMYVDDELDPQQRAEVELFMRQNPDLTSEMEMLQQAKLLPDDEIVFGNKTILLKSRNSIGVDNYEEYFLNYIDDELKTEQKHDVEKFVLQHPQFQESFTLLKQTKLEPETIVFENKQSLYRREEPRVIPLMLKRFAIAAVFLGAAALLWMILPGSGNQQTQVAKVEPIEKKDNTTTQPQNKLQQIQPLNDATVQEQIAVVEPKGSKKQKTAEKKSATQQQNIRVNAAALIVPAKEDAIVAVADNKQDRNNDAQPENLVTSNTDRNSIVPDNEATDPVDQKKNDVYAFQNTPVVNNTTTAYSKPVAYKELNTDEDVNSNTLYVGSLGLNKNKVRGIMKKVGGIFKSKNASGEENGKLQVAGFQLNTD